MAIVLLTARCVLATLLAVAGLSKTFSVGGTVRSARQFGFPERLARLIAVLLPATELGTALALVGRHSASFGLVTAAVLLAAFLAVTVQAVWRGRTVSCHCFGNFSAAAVGKATVVRNAVLFAVALATTSLTLNEPSPLGVAYGSLDATQWVVAGLGAVVLLLSGLFWRTVVALLEQQGRLLLRLDELSGVAGAGGNADPVLPGSAVGTPAPAFALRSLEGETLTLESLTSLGRPVLAVFADRQCGPCSELMPHVAHWQQDHTEELTTVVVAAGSADDTRAYAVEHGLRTVLLDADRIVSTAYESPGTPSAVLVGRDGRVMSEIVAGAPAVQALAHRVVSSAGDSGISDHSPTHIGRRIPTFSLPDLSGTVFTSEWFAQHDSTVVLFWNPSCGFCQRMEARLQHWDRQERGSGIGLLLISTGDTQALAGLRLQAPVLLDDGRMMHAFGVTGTPMAVRVDTYGVITSEVAAGEQAVFDLLTAAHMADAPLLSAVAGGAP